MLRQNYLKMNQETNTSGGQAVAAQTPPVVATPQAQGIGEANAVTELYPQQAGKAESGKEQPAQKTVSTEEIKPGAAGYVEPTAGVGTGYVEPKAVEPKAEVIATPAADEIKFDETGLTPEIVATVKEFAKTNGLSKEATESFAKYNKAQLDMVKTYEANREAQITAAREKQKGEWYNGLKSDKDFGGELFQTNLKRVDTILEKFFPDTKNMLTSNGGMLPPSVMKDLQRLHTVLLGADPMVNSNGQNGAAVQGDDQSFLKNYYSL